MVSGNGDLTGKMAMFGGFFQNVPPKTRNFCADVIRTLLQDQSDDDDYDECFYYGKKKFSTLD